MTVGNCTYKGLAVPLRGEVELKQDTAATDFVTLTGDSSISGDFLVCRASTTEKAWINSSGKAFVAGADSAANVVLPASVRLKFSAPATTAPTDMVLGEIRLVMGSTEPQLACCYGTTAASIYYFTATTAGFGL